MNEKQAEVEALAGVASRIDRMLARFDNPRGGHVVNASVHAGAGGIGVWVCVTCVLVMFVVVILQAHDKARMAEDIRELRQDNDEMMAYLQVIYQHAPHLRPKQEDGKRD